MNTDTPELPFNERPTQIEARAGKTFIAVCIRASRGEFEILSLNVQATKCLFTVRYLKPQPEGSNE